MYPYMKLHCVCLIILYQNVKASKAKSSDNSPHRLTTSKKIQLEIKLPVDEEVLVDKLREYNLTHQQIMKAIEEIKIKIMPNKIFPSLFYSDITLIFLGMFISQTAEPNYKSTETYKKEEIRLLILFFTQINDIIEKIKLSMILVKIHLNPHNDDKELSDLIIKKKSDIEKMIEIKMTKIKEQEDEYCEIRNRITAEVNINISNNNIFQEEIRPSIYASERSAYKQG